MRSRFTTLLASALLVGSGFLPFASLGFVAEAQAAIAWGERVAFESPVTGFRVFDADGKVVGERRFDLAQPSIDLSYPAALPTLDVAASDPLTEETFFTPLTVAERETYTNRGKVELQLGEAPTVVLEPYGAVLSGQVHVLVGVQGSCTRFFEFLGNNAPDPFSTLETLGVQLTDTTSLCHITFGIGAQDTREALAKLGAVLSPFPAYSDLLGDADFVLDKNSLSSLDPPPRGSLSFDPSCDQIEKWLDPFGDNGYDLISEAQLRTDVGVSGSGVTGQGVNVVIIGGGVGQNDDVRCRDALGTPLFRGHDTHIRDIIRAVAPGVNFQTFKVCNAEGTCSSAEIVRALLRTVSLARQNPQTLVNLSLGGPLPDKPTFEVLKLLGQRFGVAAIVSGGNGPFAPAHYPASYSSGVATPSSPALTNVIAIAATGLKLDADGSNNPGYVIAGFNTRANADFFAPGVNLCLSAAQTFRCATAPAAPFPTDLGATGSSFAAPVGTGLAALYLESAGLTPPELRTCLKNNLVTDAVTGLDRVAFGSAACP